MSLYRLDDYERCHECNKTKKWRDMLIKDSRFYCNEACRNKELARETA